MICLSTDTDQWPSQTAVSVIMTDLQARVMICLSTDTDQWPSETAVCVIITDLQARVMICLSTDTDQWPSETPVCCYCSKIPRPRLKSLHVHRHCPVTSRESACLSTLTCGHWKCCPPPPPPPLLTTHVKRRYRGCWSKAITDICPVLKVVFIRLFQKP